MMLEDVLCTLKDRILESGFVKQFYEYTELIQRGSIIAPGYYIGGGNYDLVYDFDVNGSGYVRKRGEVSIQLDAVKTSMLGCTDDNEFLIVSYPLRAVLGVPKVLLGDNSYSDDRLFAEMVVIFGGSYTASNVQDAGTTIQSYSTDSLSIWRTEVQGVDYQMNFRLAYISIDFNLSFNVSKSCMPEVCGYGY